MIQAPAVTNALAYYGRKKFVVQEMSFYSQIFNCVLQILLICQVDSRKNIFTGCKKLYI
jgi:hypothetical protein